MRGWSKEGRDLTTELWTLSLLQDISERLEQEEDGEQLTRTRITRDLDIDTDDFEEAAQYGRKNGFLKSHRQGKYSLEKKFRIPEVAFYDLVMEHVCKLWKQEGYDDGGLYVENTSSKDSKIAGQWTRPDVTLVTYKKFPWTIGYEFDVATFEVKRPDSANVLAVFEALAHATAATRAYVVFPLSLNEWRKLNAAQAKRVEDECARHGVGLIFIADPCGKAKAEHHIRAQRMQIDHQKTSDFLEAVLSSEGKNKIAQWK